MNIYSFFDTNLRQRRRRAQAEDFLFGFLCILLGIGFAILLVATVTGRLCAYIGSYGL